MNPLFKSINDGGVINLIRFLRSGNPDQIAAAMMRDNPQFRQFIEVNKGKTPDQVAKENGIDLSQFKNVL